MHDVVYHLTVILVAALAVIRGYRKGFTGQISAAVGIAFGVVCARLFSLPVEEMLRDAFPALQSRFGSSFLYSMASAGGVFVLVALLMQMLTRLLNVALSIAGSGVFNSLLGAIFCMLRYMLFLSVAYNIMADWNPLESKLLEHATDHDGNVVEAVMQLAPAALGVPGVEDLAHIVQLEEAKKIS